MIKEGEKVVNLDKPITGKIQQVLPNQKLVIVRWHNGSKDVVKFKELYLDSKIFRYINAKTSH